MTHNQKTLSLVEKIAKLSKYVKIITNDTENTYIWHSEHGKTAAKIAAHLTMLNFTPGTKCPFRHYTPIADVNWKKLKRIIQITY